MKKIHLALPVVLITSALIALACSNPAAAPQQPNTPLPASTAEPLNATPVPPVPPATPPPTIPSAPPQFSLSQDELSELQAELDSNRAKWRNAALPDYDFEYQRVCFCPRFVVDISVRNTSITSITNAETGARITENLENFTTVEGLFNVIQSAIDLRVSGMSAAYDPQLGYPTDVFIDYRSQTADEEGGFVISKLETQRELNTINTPTPEPLTNPSGSLGRAELDALQAELTTNLEKWQSGALNDYTFELRRICFCPPEIVGPVQVTVNGGSISSTILLETGLPTNEEYSNLYKDIEGLFEVVQDAIDREAASISAAYDSQLGYPTSIGIDYDRRIADEELGFSVSSLTENTQAAILDGLWEGEIEIGDVQQIGISVVFISNESGLSAGINIPEQFVDDLALVNVSLNGEKIHFEIAEAGAVFDGVVEGGTISGDLMQTGVSATFALNYVGPWNSQIEFEEAPPSYLEEEVTFQNGDVTLAGTLTIPDNNGPHPAVVMITGSGPQNRDEEIVGFKIFGVIADHLTRNGIAVLRYDDRGVGGSTGDVNASTIDDFTDDVLSAVALLKARPNVNPDQIGLVGHSEGGIVGPLAASRSEDIAFVVMIAGTGVPGADILRAQLEAISELGGSTEEMTQDALALQELTFDAVRTGEGWDDIREITRQQIVESLDDLPEDQRAVITDIDAFVDNIVDQRLAATQTPWFASFLDHDPRPALESVTVPVLALFGGLDVQVPVSQNRPAIEEALNVAGNEDVTVEVFDNANHLFQEAITGNFDEYANLEQEFIPGFLDTLSSWIAERTDITAP